MSRSCTSHDQETDELFESLEACLRSDPPQLGEARSAWARLAHATNEIAEADLASLCASLADVLAIAANCDGEAPGQVGEMLEFARSAVGVVRGGIEQEQDALAQVVALRESLRSRWSEYLDLLGPDERCRIPDEGADGFAPIVGVDPTEEAATASEAEEGVPEGFDIDLILASLGGGGPRNDVSNSPSAPKRSKSRASQSVDAAAPEPSPGDADPELLACFVEDSQNSLAVMEESLLKIEQQPGQDEPLRQFCRELHTLKGASGTVGLSQLSHYLHELEEKVESMAAGRSAVNVDLLLAGIDAVRSQINLTRPEGEKSAGGAGEESFTPQADPGSAEGALRVEPSRLERLMDLLAELVMLRNRRETHLHRFSELHRELLASAGRLRVVDASLWRRLESSVAETGGDGHESRAPASAGADESAWQSRTLIELANDLGALGRSLQDAIEPLERDNAAVSHLIGQFRQELMELRRLPISGLFRRLQRAVRDAARIEGKQANLQFGGEGIRAERALQEQLFEPLMHIVRNGVSHGIETSQRRTERGKSPVGQIAIEAECTASALEITIRDDGAGLDEAALQRRGRELGLLPPGQAVRSESLWQLIFHPGLSTRKDVNEVAGRGIGMDVVASRIHQLRGRIDVESKPGQGTTFRLQVPLRSAIEHALLVRAGGQLFALPMQSVYGIGGGPANGDGAARRSRGAATEELGDAALLRDLLGLAGGDSLHPQVLTLSETGTERRDAAARPHSRQGPRMGQFRIVVDAVVGVEEVVVRSLPPMLQRHELFAGVTLSGDAETVLLFDVARLIEWGQREKSDKAYGGRTAGSSAASGGRSPAAGPQVRILVVDDSLTARRHLVRKLWERGVQTVEASDGVEALDLLRGGAFDGVITDLDMPRMGGADLFAEIRRRAPFKDLPVGILTSRPVDEVTEMTPGARLVFTKPATDDTVAAILGAFHQSVAVSTEQS